MATTSTLELPPFPVIQTSLALISDSGSGKDKSSNPAAAEELKPAVVVPAEVL